VRGEGHVRVAAHDEARPSGASETRRVRANLEPLHGNVQEKESEERLASIVEVDGHDVWQVSRALVDVAADRGHGGVRSQPREDREVPDVARMKDAAR